jgi:hypothetical protein
LLISCEGDRKADEANDEALVSATMENMEIATSENGRTTSLFRAPLVEDHEFAKAAFREYRKGIEMLQYDSLGRESSRVEADYALHWTERDLWELKGNVMVTGEGGRRLFTQQLSWDRKIAKIYSNVDSKVEEGTDEFIGEGFEAADDFSRWTFRRLKGRVGVDVEPTEGEAGSGGAVGASGSGGSNAVGVSGSGSGRAAAAGAGAGSGSGSGSGSSGTSASKPRSASDRSDAPNFPRGTRPARQSAGGSTPRPASGAVPVSKVMPVSSAPQVFTPAAAEVVAPNGTPASASAERGESK